VWPTLNAMCNTTKGGRVTCTPLPPPPIGFNADQGRQGSRVFVDEENRAKCITLQTAHLRRMMRIFPQVLMMDATHGTYINLVEVTKVVEVAKVVKVEVFLCALYM
jgi:hypothetical protein